MRRWRKRARLLIAGANSRNLALIREKFNLGDITNSLWYQFCTPALSRQHTLPSMIPPSKNDTSAAPFASLETRTYDVGCSECVDYVPKRQLQHGAVPYHRYLSGVRVT